MVSYWDDEDNRRFRELIENVEHMSSENFIEKAKNGSPEMQCRLAEYYFMCNLKREANEWYRRAADKDYLPAVEALAEYAESYFRWDYVERAARLGSAYYNIVIGEEYLREAMNLGHGYLSSSWEEQRQKASLKALPYFERAAELGSGEACYLLYKYYIGNCGGRFVDLHGKNTYEIACEYRDRALKLGYKPKNIEE